MSAECEKHGVDLHGDTFRGLVCPVCEGEVKLTRAAVLLLQFGDYEAVEEAKRWLADLDPAPDELAEKRVADE